VDDAGAVIRSHPMTAITRHRTPGQSLRGSFEG
jgi:hypothetical protein